MAERTARPGVAGGQLAVRLAQRAGRAAARRQARDGGTLIDGVLLDDLHADADDGAHTAASAEEAVHEVALVSTALDGVALARHRAWAAAVRVSTLRHIHGARAQAGVPLARHFLHGQLQIDPLRRVRRFLIANGLNQAVNIVGCIHRGQFFDMT